LISIYFYIVNIKISKPFFLIIIKKLSSQIEKYFLSDETIKIHYAVKTCFWHKVFCLFVFGHLFLSNFQKIKKVLSKNIKNLTF